MWYNISITKFILGCSMANKVVKDAVDVLSGSIYPEQIEGVVKASETD